MEREPRAGDVHPIPKRLVEDLLVILPVEYVHGLRRVELRARVSAIGDPYAEYLRDEKMVRIYSVPTHWDLDSLSRADERSMRRFAARIERSQQAWQVHWTDPEKLALWFAFYVLFHELGHHFSDQYHRRRRRIGSENHAEILADVLALRLYRAFRLRVRMHRPTRAAQPT